MYLSDELVAYLELIKSRKRISAHDISVIFDTSELNMIEPIKYLLENNCVKICGDHPGFTFNQFNRDYLNDMLELTQNGKSLLEHRNKELKSHKWLNVRSWIGTIGTFVTGVISIVSLLNQIFHWF